MLFNSIQYALFLPVIVVLYFLSPQKLRVWVLLLASYFFYASWNWVYLFLIIGLTGLNYGLGLILAVSKIAGHFKRARLVLALGITLNLGVLVFYKYTLFIIESITGSFKWIGWNVAFPRPDLTLPLAISFFIFEFIHYLVDVWKGEKAVKSLPDFAVFAAFFPTQIAGPIKRFENFIPQLHLKHSFNWERTGQGLQLIILGLFKKVVLADNLAPLVLAGFQQLTPDKPGLSYEEAWLVVIAFALQIYFDFSGYTDIGRGSAILLGFYVPPNFNHPYLATSISMFWRRWHISLSTWLRDYIYIPLGGSRARILRNLFITMVLGGLWHGANWTFVVWGAYHGILLIIYRIVRRWLPHEDGSGKIFKSLTGWFITLLAVLVGWVFFRASSIDQAFKMIETMFGIRSSSAQVLQNLERWFIISVMAGSLISEYLIENIYRLKYRIFSGSSVQNSLWLKAARVSVPTGYSLLVAAILLFRPLESTRFIYFQF